MPTPVSVVKNGYLNIMLAIA